jgi:hypothetical protein
MNARFTLGSELERALPEVLEFVEAVSLKKWIRLAELEVDPIGRPLTVLTTLL